VDNGDEIMRFAGAEGAGAARDIEEDARAAMRAWEAASVEGGGTDFTVTPSAQP
jgi:hypothetical protein